MKTADFVPSFFAVGPPRTGTTWLHSRLKDRVNLPGVKETRFFDRNFEKGWGWYRAQFDSGRVHDIAGEIAPTYFYEAEGRQRIAECIPEAKIICSLREPVDRLYSFYRFKVGYGYFRGNFEDFLRDHEVMESTRYAFHLREWQRLFGTENVLVVLYDDLLAMPQKFLEKICAFIGIESPHLTASECSPIHSAGELTEPRNYVLTKLTMEVLHRLRAHPLTGAVSKALGKKFKPRRLVLGGGSRLPALSSEVAKRLRAAQAKDLGELESLLGRDLSAWKANEGQISQALIANSAN